MDGSHLADFLVAKGYEVHGVVRRHSTPSYRHLQHLIEKDAIVLHEADVTDQHSLNVVMERVKPDEVYNLAAQSHVGTSFDQPDLTLEVTGLGALRVLEAVSHYAPRARVYQASSSEMYGNVDVGVLDEKTHLSPVSPYGAAKVLAHHIARLYRVAYGMHVSSGILFNHESERRGPLFVTRKITLGLARIKCGQAKVLRLGNLDAVRDWGYAPEYVEGMWRMLQREKPGEWVLATGEGHKVETFLVRAMQALGMDPADQTMIEVTPAQKRPTDIQRLVGDPSRANFELGWSAKTRFPDLVKRMAEYDLELVRKGGSA